MGGDQQAFESNSSQLRTKESGVDDWSHDQTNSETELRLLSQVEAFNQKGPLRALNRFDGCADGCQQGVCMPWIKKSK
jgi:hypothetical protein